MNRLSRAILVADLASAVVSLLISLTAKYGVSWIRASDTSLLSAWLPAFIAVCATWTFIFFYFRLDGFRGGWHLPSITSNLTLGVLALITALFTLGYVTQKYYSREVLGVFAITLLCLLVLVRIAARSAMGSLTRSRGCRKVVIVGYGNVACELARKIQRHPELMVEVVGFLFPAEATVPASAAELNVATLGIPETTTSVTIPDILQQAQVQELIFCLPDSHAQDTHKLVSSCRKKGIHISLVPQWYELYLSKASLVDIEGLPLVSLEDHSGPFMSMVLKRTIDFAVAPLLALLSLPIILVCAAVLRTRTGKGIVRETRCGVQGREFHMWRLNVDRHAAADPFEQTLVDFSITELPQLWNVLSGDMTLVGPRPEPPWRVQRYSEWQRQRLSIPPGITGMAQVYGLRDPHSSEEKARFDLQYIYHWSPFLDLALLMQTAWTVATRLIRRDPRKPPVVVHRDSIDPRLPEVAHANSTHAGTD